MGSNPTPSAIYDKIRVGFERADQKMRPMEAFSRPGVKAEPKGGAERIPPPPPLILDLEFMDFAS